MIGLTDFLMNNPSMRLQPVSRAGETIVSGQIYFHRKYKNIRIDDSYSLSISIPRDCPYNTPKIRETGSKIPHKSAFHVNPDGTLCLGSPIRIMLLLNRTLNFNAYSEHFIIPYLFAVSAKLQGESKGMIFGELTHGKPGVVDDYVQLFGITAQSPHNRATQVEHVLWLLTQSRKKARRKRCFCGCEKPLMYCRSYRYIRNYWKALPRIAWRNYIREFKSYG